MLCPTKCANLAAYENNEGVAGNADDEVEEEVGSFWLYPGSAELLSGICCVTAVCVSAATSVVEHWLD